MDVCGPCPLFLPRQTAQKPPSLGPAQGSPVAPHGAWWATVHGVAKSRTQLSDSTVNNNMHIHIICTYIVYTHTHTHIYTQYQNTKTLPSMKKLNASFSQVTNLEMKSFNAQKNIHKCKTHRLTSPPPMVKFLSPSKIEMCIKYRIIHGITNNSM